MPSKQVLRALGENHRHEIQGFIAIKPDGTPFAGSNTHGTAFMQNSTFLRRIAPVGSHVIPATLVVEAHPSLSPEALEQALKR